jgi:hypothetical protein
MKLPVKQTKWPSIILLIQFMRFFLLQLLCGWVTAYITPGPLHQCLVEANVALNLTMVSDNTELEEPLPAFFNGIS